MPLRPLVVVAVAMTVAGAIAGAIWAWLAPAVHGAVALTRSGDRVLLYLGNERDHFFVSAVMMAGVLLAIGVVTAVWAWHFRQQLRGPEMAATLSIGGLCAGGAATAVGAGLAWLRYGGAVDVAAAPVSPDHKVHYVVEAPGVFFGDGWPQALITLLIPAALSALTYATLAAASARDDLGVVAPVEPSFPKTVG